MSTDLSTLLELLVTREPEAVAMFRHGSEDYEPEEIDEMLEGAPLMLTFQHEAGAWRCGWVWRPDEATEWTVYETGRDPKAAALALERKLDEAKQ